MDTVRWLMFGSGVVLAVISLLFVPICFGPIAIGLGAAVYATGGAQGKKYGLGLMIGAGVAMVLGFGFGLLVAMSSLSSAINTTP